ncbi:MAG: chemotaxis protein CheD [Bacteroidota bacterium]
MLNDKKMVTIYSGNYYVSNDPKVVIYTLLGSCIAVCLFDAQKGIGGMNHFMLPQQSPYYQSSKGAKPGWFGSDSLDLMIDEILKLGGSLSHIKAKVFGGAQVVENLDLLNTNVPTVNINFTINYLNQKKIPIIAKDVGGYSGRKIYYYLMDNSVIVRRLEKELKSDG